MNFQCTCGRTFFVSKESLMHLTGFFKIVVSHYTIAPMCDVCGETILKNYKDTYGIGV